MAEENDTHGKGLRRVLDVEISSVGAHVSRGTLVIRAEEPAVALIKTKEKPGSSTALRSL